MSSLKEIVEACHSKAQPYLSQKNGKFYNCTIEAREKGVCPYRIETEVTEYFPDNMANPKVTYIYICKHGYNLAHG